jgi:prolyl oligopeptidase
MTRLLILPLVAAGLTAVADSTPAATAPPPTRIDGVKETIHGVEIVDNYRWLEGDNSDPRQMGAPTDEVSQWTDAQNAYTRSVLDNLPGRKQVEERLRPLMEIGSISTPNMAGTRYFYSKREGSQNQPLVYVREKFDGPERVLLDPAEIDRSGLVTVSWYTPSHDGKLLAFGMYRSGDENSTLYVMDVDSGRWLADEIGGKVNGVNWLPDGSGFFYERLADIKNPYSGTIRFHKLGTHHRQDPILFSQTEPGEFWSKYSSYTADEQKQLATTYGPFAYTSRDARWMILGYATGTRSYDTWVVNLEKWFASGMKDFTPVPLLSGTLKSGFNAAGPIVGDTMYMESTVNAPNGNIVAVDLNNPAPANWKVIVPERADAVLQGVASPKGMLVATYLKNASTAIEKFAYDGSSKGLVELPGIGTAGISTEEDRTEAFLAFESYNEPDSIYRLDLADGSRALWERPKVPVDPSLAEVKQVWYSSKDGTKISMFIVHKKGLKLDGDNPTILYGYGGFNVSETPRFIPTLFTWFEDGGVFAAPNLRGGGEYGEAWHKGGMLDKKQNVFDDFIAAAEWLIQNGYTSNKRLAISGGSNGGLLTGACVTQRPDLYAAALIGVPLLDMVRYHNFLMARYWVPEYGSAENPDQFAYIYKYSPYHNIKPGTKYPAVLLTAGENDSRVHPLHARKMAAALQAATAGNPSDDPILLWVDRDAGHGQGKPLNLRIRDAADQRIFFMWQLGMLK